MNKTIIVMLIAVVFILSGYIAFQSKNDTANLVLNDESSSNNNNPGITIDKSKKTSLDLSNKGLNKLPEYVLEMTELTELDISENNLEGALPSQIAKLKNLEKLDVSGNDMTGIPAEIGQLEKLEELSYADNNITGLPLEIGNLDNLKELDLRGNDYSEYDLGLIKKELPNLLVLNDKAEEAKEVREEIIVPLEIACDTGALDDQFLCMLNEYREENGKKVLSYSAKLNSVAVDHSAWMNTNSEFSHIGIDGSNFSERCINAETVCDAENLAFAANTAQGLFDVWKDSPTHNKNMLGDHTLFGFGKADSYITTVFK